MDSNKADSDKSRYNDVVCELGVARERICSLEDENAQLICKVNVLKETSMSENDISLHKDKLDHLTNLRDNLEVSISKKDDLIAELQLQLDQIISEAREQQDETLQWKNEALQTKEKVSNIRHGL